MSRRAYNATIAAHHAAQEGWNRTCHSDALREMQIVHAEELQAENLPLHGATIPLWMIPATAALTFILTIIGAHTL